MVAYSIVDHLELDTNEVIFISSNYKVPISTYRVVPAFHQTEKGLFKKLAQLNFPKAHDKYINEITQGEPFTAYIDLMSYYQKILVTHENCEQFHFMEEGNSAYMEHDDINDLTWLGYFKGLTFREKNYFGHSFRTTLSRVFRGYNLRLLAIPYHYMAYNNFKNLNFFCFSDNAFYNADPQKKVKVGMRSNDANVLKMAHGCQLTHEVIWIDGANGSFTGLPVEFYHRAIDKAIPKLKEMKVIQDRVHVKLRPGLKNVDDNYLVRKLEEQGIKVSVLPDLVLESLFITSKNCAVIGVLSSALEYAHVFGHQAFSIYGLFDKQPPTFFDRMTGFWGNINKLEK